MPKKKINFAHQLKQDKIRDRAVELIKALNQYELGSGQVYNKINPLLQQEFGHGIRKQNFLPIARATQNKVRLDFDIPIVDAPRIKADPQIGPKGVQGLSGDNVKYTWYADIKLKKRFGTKGGMITRYITIFIGRFTPAEFRAKRNTHWLNKKIVDALLEYSDLGEHQPFQIQGFWRSRREDEV